MPGDRAHIRARGITHSPGRQPLLTGVHLTVPGGTSHGLAGNSIRVRMG